MLEIWNVIALWNFESRVLKYFGGTIEINNWIKLTMREKKEQRMNVIIFVNVP